MPLRKCIYRLNLLSIFILVGLLLLTSKSNVHGDDDQEGFRCVNITKDQITDYLFKNCYLRRSEFDGRGIPAKDKDLNNAIKFLQQVHNKSQSGFLNRETCQVIQKTFIDPLPVEKLKNRIRRYAYNGYQWNKTNLTYWLKLAFPPGDPRNQAMKRILKTALSLWSDVSPFKFRKNPYFWAADIKIKFARGDHGDGFSFNGPGGVLAHTFPPKEKRYARKQMAYIHLDLDEDWNFEERFNKDRTSLLNVIAHEIGHALGLDHSEAAGGVMFRIYNGIEQLCEDDVLAIQRLYGENLSATQSLEEDWKLAQWKL
ncbi:matrix metalloproteinase-2-like [Sitodiplosis mosellana]|uniref:matrix metalloproteinase-2-like n=1 Tax=Sitodiplosis mosellana TaxID=263140 RepID=UPI0024442B12|nr:matrix metalloproteinase-2-like [Sitodiplosis mosellana]